MEGVEVGGWGKEQCELKSQLVGTRILHPTYQLRELGQVLYYLGTLVFSIEKQE